MKAPFILKLIHDCELKMYRPIDDLGHQIVFDHFTFSPYCVEEKFTNLISMANLHNCRAEIVDKNPD